MISHNALKVGRLLMLGTFIKMAESASMVYAVIFDTSYSFTLCES